jgi:hypothetical protein
VVSETNSMAAFRNQGDPYTQSSPDIGEIAWNQAKLIDANSTAAGRLITAVHPTCGTIEDGRNLMSDSCIAHARAMLEYRALIAFSQEGRAQCLHHDPKRPEPAKRHKERAVPCQGWLVNSRIGLHARPF